MEQQEIDKIIEKSKEKIAVSQFKKENQYVPERNISKIVASIILVIALSASGVYAGVITYTKIWKEPKEYNFNDELTEEEIAECISEEIAEEIGNSYLKKIGFTEEAIKSFCLEKEFLDIENIWRMNSQNVSIAVDGKTGALKSVQIPTWNYTIPKDYGITREEAREVAKELLDKYRPEGDKGEYKLIELRRNMNTDESSYIWYANFQKKYGDLLNKYEEIRIGWVPTVNGLYSLSLQRDIYENNEEKISRTEAINIAKDKDRNLREENDIKNIKAEIQIEQMNEHVYLKENYKDKYSENPYFTYWEEVYYRTEKRVRKVWAVVIEYDIELKNFTYFIDATTGEIIGGQPYDTLQREISIRNEDSNLIEK